MRVNRHHSSTRRAPLSDAHATKARVIRPGPSPFSDPRFLLAGVPRRDDQGRARQHAPASALVRAAYRLLSQGHARVLLPSSTASSTTSPSPPRAPPPGALQRSWLPIEDCQRVTKTRPHYEFLNVFRDTEEKNRNAACSTFYLVDAREGADEADRSPCRGFVKTPHTEAIGDT
jgi:hypothetical protein